MKQKSREALARAAGILDGIRRLTISDGGGRDALVVALKIIDDVLLNEEERMEEEKQ